jgi:hypothetical protein
MQVAAREVLAFQVFVYNFMPSLVVCQPSSVAMPCVLLVSSMVMDAQ